MPQLPRTRTPVVFVAYGADGDVWLRAALGRCNDDPVLRSFAEKRIIQFWWVAGHGATEPVTVLDGSPDADRLSRLLGHARSVEFTAEHPDLLVREVLVLERLTLFDESSAAREAFTRAAHQARLVNLDAEGGEQAFAFRWVTLLDLLRPANRPSPEEEARARTALNATPPEAVTFVVDRVDSATAEISRGYADGALQRLAFAFIEGDLGAPRADGGSVDAPLLLREPSVGHAIPFSVAELHHPAETIERARVRALRNRLAFGIDDLNRASAVLGRTDALRGDVEADLREVEAADFDAHRARLRRKEHARALLAWAIAEGSSSGVRGVLQGIERVLGLAKAQATATARPSALTAPALVLAAAGVGDSATIAVGGLIVVGLTALIWYRVRAGNRQDATGGLPTPLPHRDPTEIAKRRADLLRDWEALCAALERALVEWDRVCASARREADLPDRPVWRPRPPFGFELSEELRMDEDFPVSAELCQGVASAWLDQMEHGMEPGSAIDHACRAVLRRLHGRTGTDAGALLGISFTDQHVAPLRRFLATRPFLVQSALPLDTRSVVWLSSVDLALRETLIVQEPHTLRNATTVLSHEPEARSTRLVLAAPVPFRQILSLSTLFESNAGQPATSDAR